MPLLNIDDFKNRMDSLIAERDALYANHATSTDCIIEHAPIFLPSDETDLDCPPSDISGLPNEIIGFTGITEPEYSIISGLKSSLDTKVTEQQAFVDNLKRCVYKPEKGGDGNSLEEIGKSFTDMGDRITKLREMKYAYVEMQRNLMPWYVYCSSFVDSFKSMKRGGYGGGDKSSYYDIVKSSLSVVKSKLKEYTGAVEFTVKDSAFDATNSNISSPIFNYVFSFSSFGVFRDQLLYVSDNINGMYPYLKDKTLSEGESFGGVLYARHYDLMSDVMNNFFSLEERGLTVNADEAITLNTAGSEVNVNDKHLAVEQGDKKYYVKDEKKFKEFFSNLSGVIETRIDSHFNTHVQPTLSEVNLLFSNLGKAMASYCYSANSSASITEFDFIRDYEGIFGGDASSIMSKINRDISDLSSKLTNDAIINAVRANPCFKDANIMERGDIEQNIDLVGPLKSITGTDPENPDPWDDCYWIVFARLATQFGILPFPDVNRPVSMRYWGIGLKLPTPAGIVNIPMPLLWFPLMTVTSPMGIVVLFLGQCGVTPNIYLFYAGNDGTKKFIVTMRGPSEPFGFREENGDMFDIFIPMLNIKYPMLDIEGLMDLLFKPGNVDVGDIIDQLRDYVIKFIMGLNIPDFAGDLRMFIDYLFRDILRLPVIMFPSFLFKFKWFNLMLSLLKNIEDLLNANLNIDFGTKFLKQFLRKVLADIRGDLDINELFNNLTSPIDVFGDFESFKNTLKKIIYYIMNLVDPRHFVDSDLYNFLYNIEIQLMGCRKIIDLPPFDPIAFIKSLFAPLLSAIDSLSIDMLRELLGDVQLTVDNFLSFLGKLIDKFVPDLLLSLNFNTNLMEILKMLAGAILGILNIDFDLAKIGLPKIPSITIDCNRYLDPIRQYIDNLLREYGADIQYNTAMVKQMLIEAVFSVFDKASDTMQPIIDVINPVVNTLLVLLRVMKLGESLNIFEAAMDPVGTAKKLAKIAAAMVGDILGKGLFFYYVDPKMLAKALEELEKMGLLNYVVISAGCSTPKPTELLFRKSVRAMHPLLRQDDIPPFERLTLDNPLFCLFLDDFCKVSKKYTLFGDMIL